MTDADAFKTALSARVPERLLVFDSVGSTNDVLKEKAAPDSLPDGTAAIALEQTAGKGRLGRSFHSPRGAGVYLSVLRRFGAAPGELTALTAQAAVACARAAERLSGKRVGIKWVNDLYLERKIAGILCESIPLGSAVTGVVVGIGVNCREPAGGYPKDVEAQALGVADPLELSAALIGALRGLTGSMSADELAYYKNRSTVLGKEVVCTRMGTEIVRGTAEDITPEGFLAVRRAGGERVVISSGEVTLRACQSRL